MNDINILEIMKDSFSFLEKDYDCKIKCKKENFGLYLKYFNTTTGIIINYEYREAYCFVVLCKLNPQDKTRETLSQMNNYRVSDKDKDRVGLDFIMLAKNPNVKTISSLYNYDAKHKYHNLDGIILYFSDIANNLKEYAEEILLGDFSLFNRGMKFQNNFYKK